MLFIIIYQLQAYALAIIKVNNWINYSILILVIQHICTFKNPDHAADLKVSTW